MNESTSVIQKPYSLPISLDYIDYDSSFLIDNGEFISIFILNQNKQEVYESLFNCDDYNTIEKDNIDESNESELNIRLFNIINQLRQDNSGIVQPYRTFFINEKQIQNDELISLLSEDHYKEEPFYVDYLADIHGQIQSKMS